MRKVLSLIAMLVTAVTAMAQQTYTSTTSSTKLGSWGDPTSFSTEKTLTVTDKGNNVYDVQFNGVEMKSGNYTDSYGDILFEGVEGTTSGDLTTISVTDATATMAAAGTGVVPADASIVGAELLVKFNGTAAYATFTGQISYKNAWTGAAQTKDFFVSYGVDDFPETPVTPTETVIKENYQADGNGFSETVNVDWDTQKVVASIDFSNGGDDKDILAMTTGDSFTNFQVSSYRTMHWYCTQSKSQVAGFYALAGGSNNNTGRIDVENCLAKFEISKADGLKLNGNQVMSAEVLEELFSSNTLLIGSGESPKYSTSYYNYLKVVPLDWTEPNTPDPEQPTVEATYEYTSNAMTQYLPADADNAQTVYMKDAKVELAKYSDNTYTATFKDVVVGDDNTLMGDVVFKGLVYHEAEDGENAGYGFEGTEVEVNGTTYSSQMFTMEVAQAGATPADDKLFVQFYLQNATDGSLMAYQFGDEVFIPVTQEFTNEAHVTTGDATTDLAEAKVVLTEFMEDVYRVTFKNLTLGDKTGDFTIDNLEASVDGNNVTFTTDETYGTWNDADETESTMSNFSLTATKEEGVEGLSNLVLKFTAENSNVVFGEALPTPPVENPTKEYTDKLTYTVVSGGSTLEGVNAEQQLTVEQVGENLYTLKLAKLNTYNTLYLEMGEITFANVAGTTEDGVTTIDVESPAVEMTDATYGLADAQNGHLVVTLTDDKATLEYTGTLTAYSNSYPYGLYFGVEPVVDGINNVEATGVDANAEIFTVSGAKAGNLQRGLNIVRNANGKVVKVLVK